jgi:hypothetical protein
VPNCILSTPKPYSFTKALLRTLLAQHMRLSFRHEALSISRNSQTDSEPYLTLARLGILDPPLEPAPGQ